MTDLYKKIFNLEQEIMSCWHIIDDLKLAYEYISDSEDFKGMSPEHSDKISNLLSGIKEIGDLRFQKLFATFEGVIKGDE